MLATLRRRKEWQFFAALPKADGALASAWFLVLLLRGALPAAFAIAMGALVGAIQSGDSLARAAGAGRHGVRAAAGARPDPSGVELQSRRSDRGVALRPAHGGLRHAAGHPASRRSVAHQRPHRRARVRPRDDGSAVVDRPRLHRRRPGGDRRRHRVRPRPAAVLLVGAARACGRLVRHALLPARKRRLVRSQHRRGARGAARRRLRVPARGRSARQQGTAAVRSGGLGPGALQGPPDAAAPFAVPTPRAFARGRWPGV